MKREMPVNLEKMEKLEHLEIRESAVFLVSRVPQGNQA